MKVLIRRGERYTPAWSTYIPSSESIICLEAERMLHSLEPRALLAAELINNRDITC
jgi:hypothetical protein